MGRACSINGEERNACMSLVRKPEGKRLLGRLRCRFFFSLQKEIENHKRTVNNLNAQLRWVDNIKMDLGEMGLGGMD
jgi:hypothetical protein